MEPRVIAGKYRLIESIGKGGMASVYRAEHVTTGKHVALKLLHLDSEPIAEGNSRDSSKEVIGRFEREARTSGSMETDHIVHVYDAGIDVPSGAPYIAMELLRGRDMNHVVKDGGALPVDLSLRLCGQALTGLAQAHLAGIVHRDLKPANLFLARQDSGDIIVKVLDFGIAKVQKQPVATMDTGGLTQTGSMLGTPQYMSPEQIERPKSVDARSDIWSMGVVLYKCMTGRTPQDGSETLGSMLIALMTRPAPPIQSLAPWIPTEVAAVVHRALERDPRRRFASADEMLAAVRALCPRGFGVRDEDIRGIDETQRRLLAEKVAASGDLPSMSDHGSHGTAGGVSLAELSDTRGSGPRRAKLGLLGAAVGALLIATIAGTAVLAARSSSQEAAKLAAAAADSAAASASAQAAAMAATTMAQAAAVASANAAAAAAAAAASATNATNATNANGAADGGSGPAVGANGGAGVVNAASAPSVAGATPSVAGAAAGSRGGGKNAANGGKGAGAAAASGGAGNGQAAAAPAGTKPAGKSGVQFDDKFE